MESSIPHPTSSRIPKTERIEDIPYELRKPDIHVASFPKSGRTWLAHMCCHYYLHAHCAASGGTTPQLSLYKPWNTPEYIDFIIKKRGIIPWIKFTHDIERIASSHPADPSATISKLLSLPTLLLFRDPRDVVVSYYHHCHSKTPEVHADTSLSAFIRDPQYGIPRLTTYLNTWTPYLTPPHPHLKWLCYEDLMSDTAHHLQKVLGFFKSPPIQMTSVHYAIEQSAFRKMQREELTRRELDQKPTDTHYLRVRKGEIGTYIDELSSADVGYLNHYLKKHLDPFHLSLYSF